MIFDEVFVGFRLAAGGAQEYFSVRADMVTYGKSLAGGLPVGVVCGRKDLMRRYRDDRPVDICFARGTFNSHPYVMTAMDEFLTRLEDPAFRTVYDGLDDTWDTRAQALNERLAAQDLPVRVSNLSSIWMVQYTEPSRYNWMLQYYLRAEQLALSWVGTGRLIFSLNYTDADFAEVADRFVAAAEKMKRDGWWCRDAALTNKAIRRQILKEMITRRRSEVSVATPFPSVMAGHSRLKDGVASARLCPAIHVFACCCTVKTWMPGTRPGMTNSDARRRSNSNIQARLTCFSRPGSINSPFSRYSGDL